MSLVDGHPCGTVSWSWCAKGNRATADYSSGGYLSYEAERWLHSHAPLLKEPFWDVEPIPILLAPDPQLSRRRIRFRRESQRPDPHFELSRESGSRWNGTSPIGVSASALRGGDGNWYRHALIILRRGALAFFFCPPPGTRPRIPVSALRKRGPACPTMNSSASTARRSSIRSFPLLITRKATLSARAAEARRSSSGGQPSPPSRRKRAHECAVG